MKRFPLSSFSIPLKHSAPSPLEEHELAALHVLRGEPFPPAGRSLTLGEVAVLIAELGGYDARRASSVRQRTLSIGLQRLEGALWALELLAKEPPKKLSSWLAVLSLHKTPPDLDAKNVFGRRGWSFERKPGGFTRAKFIFHWGTRAASATSWGATAIARWVNRQFMSPQEVRVLALLQQAPLKGGPTKLSLREAAVWLNDLGSRSLKEKKRLGSHPAQRGFHHLEGALEVLRNLSILSEAERGGLLARTTHPLDAPTPGEEAQPRTTKASPKVSSSRSRTPAEL